VLGKRVYASSQLRGTITEMGAEAAIPPHPRRGIRRATAAVSKRPKTPSKPSSQISSNAAV